MKYLIAVILAMLSLTAHADPFEGWTKEEKEWFALSEAVQIIDYQTTRDLLYAQKEKGYYELNPIVGRNPSPSKLMAFEVGTLIGNYFFTDWLDHDSRMTWLKWHVGIELIVIQHNISIGARIQF